MSTIDTSTWSPDTDLNTAIEGIPLNADSPIAQTWLSIRALMAALKGDGDAIRAFLVPFTGATASIDGASGLVPAPEAGDQDKVLKGDGTWGTLSVSDIPNIDASKITSGTIDLARLPAGALERLVTVADQTARYALTDADVQLGDTVKQLDTGVMYIVVDTSKLGQADGYVEYTAGSAASVPWSGVTGKPSAFTPSSHMHGNITNDGKIGTVSGVPLITGTGGVLQAGSFGTAAGTFCQGNDSRLSDSRTPKSHTHGNITNAGAIGSTSGLPVVTGANGVLQAGSFGTTAGTICQGNDSRLSDARTPTSHTHGSITNDGKLGTASRVVVTDGDKKIAVSSVTSTELGYLSGVTSAVQTQIDAKMLRGSYERIQGTSSEHNDLNNYKTAGFYNVKTQYVDNCPSGIGVDAVLLVYPWNSANYLTQELTESAASSGVYRWLRKLNNNTWSIWEKVAFSRTTLAGYGITDAKIASGTITLGSSTITPLTSSSSLNAANLTGTASVDTTGNAATATEFSANKSIALTGDVTGSASSKAGWSIPTTVGKVTNAQIDDMFENDGVEPQTVPVANPERAVLCGDGVWRYFEQIPF